MAAALWLNLPPVVYGQLQLETIQVFFATLAACATLELLTRKDWRDAVVVGLSVGVGVWAKPTAGAVLPAAALALVVAEGWTGRDRARMLAVIGGAFAVPLLTCGWLLQITGMIGPLPETLRQLHDYSTNSTAQWSDFVKPLVVLAAVMFPVLVLGVAFRRDRVGGATRGVAALLRERAIVRFAVAWLMMELLGVVAQRRMYAYHFLVVGPPAALMLGLFARRLRVASLALALGPVATICLLWSIETFNSADRHPRTSAVIEYLRRTAGSGDSVWMDDYPRLMVETDLRPASRVPLTFLFGNSDRAPLHFGGIILEDFAKRPPRWLVLYHDVDRYIDFYHRHMVEIAAFPERGANFARAWREIDGYARSNYVVVERIDNLDILRRADALSDTR